MPIIRCPQCSEKMQVDRGDLGERVVCPGCDHRFAAREDAPDDDRPSDRGRPNSRLDDGFDRPRQPAKSNKLLWIILALVGLFVVLPCLGCVGFVIYVNTAKESFAGPWTDHSVTGLDSGSAAVSASFPAVPVSSSLNDSLNSGTGSALAFNNMDQAGSMKDALFLIGYIDYPAGTTNPLDKGYLQIRTELTATHLYNPLMAPRIASEKSTTLSNNYPAKEAKYMDDDGGYVLQIIHVNDRPRGSTARLVIVLAGGVGMKDEDKQKFLNSVKIGKGK